MLVVNNHNGFRMFLTTIIVEIWHNLALAEASDCLHSLFLGQTWAPWGYSCGREA